MLAYLIVNWLWKTLGLSWSTSSKKRSNGTMLTTQGQDPHQVLACGAQRECACRLAPSQRSTRRPRMEGINDLIQQQGTPPAGTHLLRLDGDYLKCSRRKAHILARANEASFNEIAGGLCQSGPLDPGMWETPPMSRSARDNWQSEPDAWSKAALRKGARAPQRNYVRPAPSQGRQIFGRCSAERIVCAETRVQNYRTG